jgi:hypothetical protein
MRFLIIIILICLSHFYANSISVDICSPDTIPPPPPGGPAALAGPASACSGDTSLYTVEVPVACTCQWSVNGAVQPDTTPSFSIIWTQPGNYDVSVLFVCEGGQVSEPDSILTYVGTMPPAPIQGPGTSCQGFQSTYTTSVGPGEICHWTVDGILQPTTSTTLYVTWQQLGQHSIEARAEGACGTSDPTVKNVTVTYFPDVDLGNDTLLQTGQTILLNAGNPGCSYFWSTGATTQTLLVIISGTYSVQVTNACGSDEDEIIVTILVGVPEPDRQNQLVLASFGHKLRIVEVPDNIETMQIFDLTGRLLFDGKPLKEMMLPSPGIYFLKAISPRMTLIRKFIIR